MTAGLYRLAKLIVGENRLDAIEEKTYARHLFSIGQST